MSIYHIATFFALCAICLAAVCCWLYVERGSLRRQLWVAEQYAPTPRSCGITYHMWGDSHYVKEDGAKVGQLFHDHQAGRSKQARQQLETAA